MITQARMINRFRPHGPELLLKYVILLNELNRFRVQPPEVFYYSGLKIVFDFIGRAIVEVHNTTQSQKLLLTESLARSILGTYNSMSN